MRRCREAGEECAGGEAVFAADEGVEAFEREGEVGAALVVGDGVDFVDDDGADAAEVLARLAGGEQDVERLGRGDEDVRRVAQHGGALFGERVAGADAGADFGGRDSRAPGRVLDLGERAVEVFLDVVGERLEGRDVDDLGAGARLPAMAARSSWSMQTRNAARVLPEPVGAEMSVASPARMRASLHLRLGGGAEFGEEPLGGDGVRPGEGGGDFEGIRRSRAWVIVARSFVLCSPERAYAGLRVAVHGCRCSTSGDSCRACAAFGSSSRYCSMTWSRMPGR